MMIVMREVSPQGDQGARGAKKALKVYSYKLTEKRGWLKVILSDRHWIVNTLVQLIVRLRDTSRNVVGEDTNHGIRFGSVF
jgi:hypothetical protein